MAQTGGLEVTSTIYFLLIVEIIDGVLEPRSVKLESVLRSFEPNLKRLFEGM